MPVRWTNKSDEKGKQEKGRKEIKIIRDFALKFQQALH
jgi:hypothetical protein